MEGIAGRTAIITGGASGLGAGMVRAFAQAGVRVVIADILEAAGRRLAEELTDAVSFQPTDLRSDEQIDALVAHAVQRFGGIDFLVNVACSYAENGVASARATWQAGFDVNLFGHAILIQKCVPHLAKSGVGSVVNVSSASGHIAQAGRWVYPASKAAIEQLTRSAALELAPMGIRVNSLLPGMVGKAEGDYPSPEAKAKHEGMAARASMLGRLQLPQEAAEAALFLCSTHARYITGALLAADAGYTALGPMGKELHVPRRN